jgi:hypothetical protein
MRRILDLAFVFGNGGLALFLGGMVFRGWQYLNEPDAYAATSRSWAIVCGAIACVWIGLLLYSLLDWRRRSQDTPSLMPWGRVLLQNFLLVGPTAYYLGVGRSGVGGGLSTLRGHRVVRVLDQLVRVVFWSPIGAVFILCVVTLAPKPTVVPLFAAAGLLIALTALVSPSLQILFLWHAMVRFGIGRRVWGHGGRCSGSGSTTTPFSGPS